MSLMMVVGEEGRVGLVSSVKDDLFNLFRVSIFVVWSLARDKVESGCQPVRALLRVIVA